MASAILLLVMVPAALLLASANSSSASAQYRVTALSVASGYLDEVQALQSVQAPGGDTAPFDADATCTPTNTCTVYAAYFGSCLGTSSCQQWPSGPSNGNFSFPTRKVGNITYDITAAGGWCQDMTNGANTASQWVEPGSQSGAIQSYAFNDATGTYGLNNVYAFWVAVKVSWGGTLTGNAGYVVQYGLIPAESGWPG